MSDGVFFLFIYIYELSERIALTVICDKVNSFTYKKGDKNEKGSKL